MAQTLTLTAPETKPTITTWAVQRIYVDRDAPAVKIDFKANTGETRIWRYAPDGVITPAQVNAAISYINQGKFMTVEGKSLQKWAIDEAQQRGVLGAGSVSGTVD